MRAWLIMCAGLVAWTAHFIGLYAIASIWPGQSMARWLGLAFSLAVLLPLIALARAASRRRVEPRGTLDRWMDDLGLAGIALGAVAIVYQAIAFLF